ncbi:Dabb family protein [Pedobacter cryotolerans]|uniref:Dabb family protein n=1 Tax=Pedobacter cryotolerans TaxID=2571270 RepID=A0A4U1BW90_9SPHI|nr:Dabb family protein [Pedobacter cryotolerans]TKB96537.1 Dabb family protein [Pedobacter cryotolerans]
MKRKQFIAGAILTAASGTVMAKQIKSESTGLKKGNIIHNVYFWLKDGISKTEEEDFLRYFELLAKIPLVQTINYGKAAPTPKREVVDHSYSYHLIITFKNLQDITAYGNHPDHAAGAEQFKKYWQRVEVKDTIII